MIVPPFEGPMLKVGRGFHHVEALKQAIDTFRENVTISLAPMPDERAPNEGMDVWRLHFSYDPRRDLALIIGDAAHNFRASLDMMIGDLIKLRKPTGVGRARYPFGVDANAVRETYRKNLKNLGDDILEAILATQPYKGGGLLRNLHMLDIADKHELLTPSFLAAGGQIALPIPIGFPVQRIYANSRFYVQKGVDPRSFIQMLPEGPSPYFHEASPFPDEPVVETLENAGKLVHEIISVFADKFGRRDNEAEAAPDRPADFIEPPQLPPGLVFSMFNLPGS